LYYPKILARREQFRGAGTPACRVETRLDAWARQTEASTQILRYGSAAAPLRFGAGNPGRGWLSSRLVPLKQL
jgi:hypothetical protein